MAKDDHEWDCDYDYDYRGKHERETLKGITENCKCQMACETCWMRLLTVTPLPLLPFVVKALNGRYKYLRMLCGNWGRQSGGWEGADFLS